MAEYLADYPADAIEWDAIGAVLDVIQRQSHGRGHAGGQRAHRLGLLSSGVDAAPGGEYLVPSTIEDAAFWRRACQLDPILAQRGVWADDEDDQALGGKEALPAA